jgi:cell division protein DivIC
VGAIKKRNITKINARYAKEQEEYQKNASRKKTLLIRRLMAFFLFASVITYFMISTLLSQASTLDKMNGEKNKLDGQLAELKRTETILKEDIIKLNDDEYIAKLARKDYFLSEKNEIIFSLPQETEENISDGSDH